jgi:hypothetical protein
MLHYVYYPFPKTSALSANASVLKRFTEKYSSSANNSHDENAGNHSGEVLRYKGASLGDIRDDDMLMISSHGGLTDPTTIVSDKGVREMFNDEEKLTANDLAKQLSGADLPKSHVLIKMLSCYAGGVLTHSSGGPVRTGMGATGEDFFAKLLAIALKTDYQYGSIIVGGFAGPLLNATVASRRAGRVPMKGNAHLYNRVGIEGGSAVDSHDHIHWFNGDGQAVPRATISARKNVSDLTQGSFVEPSRFQKEKGMTSIFKRG